MNELEGKRVRWQIRGDYMYILSYGNFVTNKGTGKVVGIKQGFFSTTVLVADDESKRILKLALEDIVLI